MVPQRKKVTYEDAGVHIDKASQSLRSVHDKMASTFDEHVLSGIRHFGSLYSLSGLAGKDPTLVTSADGVGTKLKVAFMAGRHGTVGVDIVNHCVNDIAVQGARPLFFLDYLAMGRLEPGVFQEIMEGLVRGCRENKIALIGGETAEMPDFYPDGEYDLAGFIVGIVERDRIYDGGAIRGGDLLLGLASSGLHTNGYSLVRKVLFEIGGHDLDSTPSGIDRPLVDELLEPHRSYLKAVDALRDSDGLKAMIHVTGGGFVDNIPRVLPEGFSARIDVGSWKVPGIFRLLVALAGLDMREAFRTFNMGIGFIFVIDPEKAGDAAAVLKKIGYESFVIGAVERGGEGIRFEGI